MFVTRLRHLSPHANYHPWPPKKPPLICLLVSLASCFSVNKFPIGRWNWEWRGKSLAKRNEDEKAKRLNQATSSVLKWAQLPYVLNW